MSTDTGHNSTSGDLNWALGQEEKQKEFGYRAMYGAVEFYKLSRLWCNRHIGQTNLSAGRWEEWRRWALAVRFTHFCK